MSNRRGHAPPAEHDNEVDRPLKAAAIHAKPAGAPFGLSPAQFARVMRAMLAVARSVGDHAAVSPRDAVQQAFVKALCNSESKRPSTENFEEFVRYMCTLAKLEALSNRQFARRQQRREAAPDTNIAEWIVEPNEHQATEARMSLKGAFLALEPEEQALLHALYHEGKTIDEIKEEQNVAWSTLDYRKKRILDRLYVALRALIAALLLAPKKVRAFVAHVSQQLPQLTSTLTVTAAFGVLLPTSSYLGTSSANQVGLTQVDGAQTNPVQLAGLPPSFVPEVAPEEPNEVDTATNACSPEDMKCSQITRSVVKNLVPMTLLLGVATCQGACAGSSQKMSAAQEPEEEEDGMPDPYDVVCRQDRARGEKCMTREEYRKWVGLK